MDDSLPAFLRLCHKFQLRTFLPGLLCLSFCIPAAGQNEKRPVQAALFSSFAWQQPFTWQIASIEVINEQGIPYERPFLGGFNIPRPQLVDIDSDGDLDLFIQEKPDQIIFFEQDLTRTGSPFVWRSNHFQELDVGEWFRFADIDGDGDEDLLTERRFGLIQYFKNEGSTTSPNFFLAADTLFDHQGAPVFVDRTNIPNITDIDCNGQLDLFVGRLDGTIRRYEIDGFSSENVPQFALVDERFQDIEIVAEVLGKREAKRHGANTLTFVDIDADGDQDLFWGDFFEAGLLYFENTGSCEAPQFSNEPTAFPPDDPIKTSGYNAPAFGDVDRDGNLDLLVGVLGGAFSSAQNVADNLYFYQGAGGTTMIFQTARFLSNLDFGSDGYPVLYDLDGDEDLDLVVTNSLDPGSLIASKASVFENQGSRSNPVFHYSDSLRLDPAFNYTPTFGDLDGDGDADMLVGSWQGPIVYYKKEEPALTGFVRVAGSFLELPPGSGNTTPVLVDIDADLDLDLVVGEANGTLNLFRNTGSARDPVFDAPEEEWLGIDVGRRSVPVFNDIDSDGDVDLIIGTDQDGLLLYRNTGTAQLPVFQLETGYFDIPLLRRMVPAIADIDADGDVDLFAGTLEGGILFFENEALASSKEKQPRNSTFLFSNYPNPFVAKTTIRIESSYIGLIDVKLFDLTGREVMPVYNGLANAEILRVEIDLTHVPAGVYFLRLTQADGSTAVHPIVRQ